MIYLDMDGVFVDFHTWTTKHCGFPYASNPEKAWSILDEVPHFFRNLPETPYARAMYQDILDLAAKHKQDIAFLTALPRPTGLLATAVADKTDWVHNHLDPKAKVICVPNWKYKAAYCKIGDILIDDTPRNVLAWNKVCGNGILHFQRKLTIDLLKFVLEME